MNDSYKPIFFHITYVSSLILYELKQDVAAHLASVCENDLAQAMVEGYYALLGCDVCT